MTKNISLFIATMALLGSCNYLDVEPKGQIIPHTVSDYRAMLTSAYSQYPNHKTMLAFPCDEVGDIATDFGQHAGTQEILTWNANSSLAREYVYMQFYKTIFYANDVIANIMDADPSAISSDPTVQKQESKEQILAEAYALRAYCYFDLLNMYAKWYDPLTASTDKGVPVTTTIDIKQKFPRATVENGYARVLQDLALARDNMQVQVQPQGYNYRFSLLALNALQTRIYLYRGEYDEAFVLAKTILDTYTIPLVDMVANPTEKPYAQKSTEAILTLEKVFMSLVNDRDGSYISQSVVDLYKTGDARLDKYIKKSEISTADWMCYRDIYRCLKQDDKVSFRASEIYLIAAESALKQASPSIEDARKYLGLLQVKRIATPPDLSAMTSEQLLVEIEQERTRELIFEGHRWFDLRRTSRPAITKNMVTQWYYDYDTSAPVIETKEYKLNANDMRYILPFPRSAKAVNPYLND